MAIKDVKDNMNSMYSPNVFNKIDLNGNAPSSGRSIVKENFSTLSYSNNNFSKE